ncbi:MAG: hypothetical protein ABJD99_06150, partial [Roseibium sp.]
MKRAVLVVGAGASVEYQAPSTVEITAEIEQQVMADSWMIASAGDNAFQHIKTQLEAHLKAPGDVNFEHIYHCAHELSYWFAPAASAVNEYRPILSPFID